MHSKCCTLKLISLTLPIRLTENPSKPATNWWYPVRLKTENLYFSKPLAVAHGGELRSQPLRLAAAQLSRHIIDSLLEADSLANIIVMGDFNDDPTNLSTKDYLQANFLLTALRKNNCTIHQLQFLCKARDLSNTGEMEYVRPDFSFRQLID